MTLYERWEGCWGFQRPTVLRNPQTGRWIALRPGAVSLMFDTFAEAGANLARANLARADLTVAVASDLTRWPDGFDPAARGVLIR